MGQAAKMRNADPSDASRIATGAARSAAAPQSGIAHSGEMDQLVDVLERAVARRTSREEDRFRRGS
jgi:hypothetical protein